MLDAGEVLHLRHVWSGTCNFIALVCRHAVFQRPSHRTAFWELELGRGPESISCCTSSVACIALGIASSCGSASAARCLAWLSNLFCHESEQAYEGPMIFKLPGGCIAAMSELGLRLIGKGLAAPHRPWP